MLLTTSIARCADPVAKQFLRYVYGADGIDLVAICQPSDDLWMLRGRKNEQALFSIEQLRFETSPTGVRSFMINNGSGMDVCFLEIKERKIDPAFMLDSASRIHRQLALRLIYAALSGNQSMLKAITTDASKVQILGPRTPAPPGDMDVYGGVLEAMPVIRVSKPADDAKSKTVTYRVPLGSAALSLIMVRQADGWKIDTAKGVSVPLEFFYR